jgi:hypothetical protein
MKKKKVIFLILVAMLLFIESRCLFVLDTDSILQELKKLNIEVTGPAKQIEETLPAELSGPNYGLKKIICERSGWNLSAFAGKKVLFTCFPIKEKYENELLNVWVISYGEKIVCIYKTVREGSALTPGIFPVGNPQKDMIKK